VSQHACEDNPFAGFCVLQVQQLSGMSIELLRKRLSADTFIEPCLPSPADKPPVRLKLDSRDQARRLPADGPRDPVGIRLITRRGNDWTTRYPLVAEAVWSCLIDGEVVCCDPGRLAMNGCSGCILCGKIDNIPETAEGRVQKFQHSGPPTGPPAHGHI
jgi:hypothetical protein